MDIGAPCSVVGRKELNRILTEMGKHHRDIRPSSRSFRFGDVSCKSRGTILLMMETPTGIPPVEVNCDIVDVDVPALLGMDVLDREKLIADTVSNRLVQRIPMTSPDGKIFFIDGWSVPMKRSSSSHVYVKIDTSTRIHFTRAQLSKLHRQFFHPSASKLYNLLKKARPDEVDLETLETLQDISKRCDPCQRIKPAATRFRVSFGAEDVRFNERLLIDLMFIGTKPILHIVDEATRFSAARFMKSTQVEDIWGTLLTCWAAIYTGLPNRILVDQGPQFGDAFIRVAAMNNVEASSTGVEAHSSLGLGERYHEPLRSTFRKMRIQYPNAEDDMLLSFAVKAMNDTLGPEGFVPSALVFGEYPHVFTKSEVPHPRATAADRAEMVNAAREEVGKIMAKLRVNRALRHSVPIAADKPYEPGDSVLVWREKQVNHRIGEWLGPFIVHSFDADRKLVYIQDSKIGAPRPFNVVQVKRYITPEVLAHSFFTDIGEGLSSFSSPPDDNFMYPTEILHPRDPRANGPEMGAAVRKEIKGLLDRGTFKVILREEVPPDANVLPGRFVLAIKSSIDGEVKFKARYVIGGHRDKLKHMMVHSATTLQPQSIRLLLALANIHGFDVWSSDVRQAYLQSAEPLAREIFIDKPVPEFELEPHQCLQLMKPLYGLCESGDMWHRTLDDHHRNDLGMSPFRSDPAMYKIMADGMLQGISGGYVDDLLRTGSAEFRHLSRKTHERFEMDDDENLPVTFSGFTLARDKDGSIIQDQHIYLSNLEALDKSASFSAFRSMRMKLAWLANTRPDCLFEISQLSQVTEDRFKSDKNRIIRRLNKAVKYAVDNRIYLRIPKLDLQTLRVVGYSDASFANNHDLSTQLGVLCFLADDKGNSVPIHFKSYKSKRVVRSAMAGEVIAFSDLFDVAAALASELGVLYDRNIPVQLLTDSKSLFDVISKGSRTSGKRMMLDIAATREGFRNKVISDIGFVRSSKNLADGLTKAMSQAALQHVISTGRISISPEQWIIRD